MRLPVTRAGLVLALPAVGLFAAASLAWACVPQPRLITLHPRASGPAGSEVTVRAIGFDPGRAEIRWNGADGELLEAANGPDFSVKVTIPQAAEGLYHIIVLARSPSGELGNTTAVSFQVTAAGGVPAAGSSPASPPAAAGNASRSDDAGRASVGLLAVAGAGLVGMGGAGGVIWSRRRWRQATLGDAGQAG